MLWAVWEPRREGLTESSLARLARRLSRADPALADWYRLARSPRQARQRPIDLRDADAAALWLGEGINRAEIPPHRVMRDLGWTGLAWNGSTDEARAASLIVSVGRSSPSLHNSITVSFSDRSRLGRDLRTVAACVRLMAELFDPLWVSLCTDDGPDNPPGYQIDADWRFPPIGWVMFLSRRGWPRPDWARAQARRLGRKGLLVTATRRPLDLARPDHVHMAFELEHYLELNRRWRVSRLPIA